MTEISMHAFVSGRVQGVWFRQSTKDTGQSLGLKGWVRNLSDGRVEVQASGEDKAVRQLEAWLGQGPELANVAEVECTYAEAMDLPFPFEVR
ncbi:acylphosphatase [Neptuniibacter caesariensis]|uniref:Acylphosphatase n=1 Tax=Neptuniibacter caesariensis TaxID=207954 RepID=A0A7U8GRD0_NEPCE|nr:acylphosphatase [Neptuniibacter caesariensis]EAR61242.1 Acylphosphatase [Oceanospirillum sp. MED92] [Neptuniibacter caesariensis]